MSAGRSTEVRRPSGPLWLWFQLPSFLSFPQTLRSGTVCPRSPRCEYNEGRPNGGLPATVSSFWPPGENAGIPAFHKWLFFTSKFLPVNSCGFVPAP